MPLHSNSEYGNLAANQKNANIENVIMDLAEEVVCKTWAGLIGLGSTLGWALLNFVLGWAQIWAGLKYGLGSIEGHFRQKVN